MHMNTVYVLQHEYEQWGVDNVKFIGVYSTYQEAETAIKRLLPQPGFRNWPKGFTIDSYELNVDHWVEGFDVIVPIYVKTLEDSSNPWHCVFAEWLPGDLYKILPLQEDNLKIDLVFTPNQVVKCIEQEIDGNPKCLVAIKLEDEIDLS